MTPILIALSVWLHAVGTVILIGHYLLLSVIYLPVLEKGGGGFLSQTSLDVRIISDFHGDRHLSHVC
jgi:hypothetical protein